MNLQQLSPLAGYTRAGLIEMAGEEWQDRLALAAREDDFLRCVGGIALVLVPQMGPISSEGFAVRLGRSVFHYFLRSQGQNVGINVLEFRLQPTLRRLRKGLEALNAWLQEHEGLEVGLRDTDQDYLLEFQNIPPFAHGFFCGFFQEFFEWASNGKTFLYHHEALSGSRWQLCFPKIPFEQ